MQPPTSTPRRALLGAAAALAAAAAFRRPARPAPAAADAAGPSADAAGVSAGTHPYAGAGAALRHPGLVLPQLPHLLLLAYDTPGAAAELREVCERWSAVLDRERTALTATLGIGPAAAGRLGLVTPVPFADLPPLPGDRLDPALGGGDVLLQLTGACAQRLDALAAALEVPGLVPRWRRHGYVPAGPAGQTPRNLFGFKDGSANPGPAEGQWIWLPSGPCAGGSFLVHRRIAMDTTAFAALPPERQEAVVGRRRTDGSPLGGTREHEDPDLYAKTPEGRYLIPATAHIRLTNSRLDGGARMLRRGYTYTDGPGEQGLLFCAYLRDPALFVRVQERLAQRDALTPFVEHRASGVYYLPPPGPPGTALGASLFGPARYL
ncbi:Dyp-type peroxidase [Kitasatospora sp. NPDC002227]|uniref:Dyp-type peroxidase n=1 Tax=Kitasatospora sp. NPDC002227 TaxID=3154773 RepID=UPI0033170994